MSSHFVCWLTFFVQRAVGQIEAPMGTGCETLSVILSSRSLLQRRESHVAEVDLRAL